jgi:tRNA(Ile2) C34 agmatinyltransferase TiaS
MDMTTTLIVMCPKCGGLMMASKGQKTKLCPYCGTRVDMSRAQRIASASNAFKASVMLRKLKSEQGFPDKIDY